MGGCDIVCLPQPLLGQFRAEAPHACTLMRALDCSSPKPLLFPVPLPDAMLNGSSEVIISASYHGPSLGQWAQVKPAILLSPVRGSSLGARLKQLLPFATMQTSAEHCSAHDPANTHHQHGPSI